MQADHAGQAFPLDAAVLLSDKMIAAIEKVPVNEHSRD